MKEIKIPKSRNGQATFNLILDKAIELFYKQGYHNTTIADITGQAGVAAGTFYLYFPNKIELYKYILTRIQHEIRRHITENVTYVE